MKRFKRMGISILLAASLLATTVTPAMAGESEAVSWSDVPVFTNTLKDGSLSISKSVQDADAADPDQLFHFKVRLTGDNIEDKVFEYDLNNVRNATAVFNAGEGFYDGDESNNYNAITARTKDSGATWEYLSGEYLEPERAGGYVFDGWYTDDTYETPFIYDGDLEDYVPDRDIEVYAKWIAPLTVTFDVGADGAFEGSTEHTLSLSFLWDKANGEYDLSGLSALDLSGYSAAASAGDLTFAGWVPDGETEVLSGTQDHAMETENTPAAAVKNDILAKASAGETQISYKAKWSSPNLKYAVSVYGIGVDKNKAGDKMGLSFGPAVGDNYINSAKSHEPTDTTKDGTAHRCIHDDDWDTIIYWNNKDPYVYEQCIDEGCTHSVDLDRDTTSTIFNMGFSPTYTGDGPSVLYYELMQSSSNYENLRWHPNGGTYGTNSGGWGATRIRAMLNGADDLTDVGISNYSGNASSDVNKSASVYDSDNCLFAAFPTELQDAIGERAVKYDSVYNSKTEANLKTSYDKLWLLSPNEIWSESQNTTSWATHPLEGSQYPYFAAKSNMSGSSNSQVGTRGYYVNNYNGGNGGSSFYWWLRAFSGRYNNALYVYDGGVVNYDGAYSGNGVSPCFTLNTTYEYPVEGFKYAVSVGGIGVMDVAKSDVENSEGTTSGSIETEEGGLTFVPALGANYVQSYKRHEPTGTTEDGNAHRCIHDDNWDTIIYWNNADPYVYEQCIEEGCTHTVVLDKEKTDTILNKTDSYYNGTSPTTGYKNVVTGDGPSVLYYELVQSSNNYENLRWHPHNNMPGNTDNYGTNYDGWGATRIRAMLNGADDLTDTGDDSNQTAGDKYSTYASDTHKSASVYTTDNSLLAAFPKELQDAIGQSAVKYDSVYNSKTEANLKTSYDKLFLLSPNEIWSTTQNTSSYYTHPLEGNQYPYFAAKSDMSGSASSQEGTKGYYVNSSQSSVSSGNGGSSFYWWLRASNGNYYNIALDVSYSGNVVYIGANVDSGVSPCFTLSRQSVLSPHVAGLRPRNEVVAGLRAGIQADACTGPESNIMSSDALASDDAIFLEKSATLPSMDGTKTKSALKGIKEAAKGMFLVDAKASEGDGNDAAMEDGVFDVYLKAGEEAVFNGIPAGTSYQVWEETPDGWVLAASSGASGVIEPLEVSSAAFVNRYRPGSTSAQFSGVKLLDGAGAERGLFSFTLYDVSNTPIETCRNKDGGAFMFNAIEYESAGDYVYYIRENDPSGENGDLYTYDTHTETVTVRVTDNGEGHLHAETLYDSDGIVFNNKTNPGSIGIKKEVTGTDATPDVSFTYKITLTDKVGRPFETDDLKWHKATDTAVMTLIRSFAQSAGIGGIPHADGIYYVTGKAGEEIIIDNIPAGTTYAIEEINNPDGWQYENGTGIAGVTEAAKKKEAVITNHYSAEGLAYILAHKQMEGDTFEEGAFTFELLDDKGEVIDTKTNGSIDTAGEVMGDRDDTVPNEWINTAPVRFDDITYDAPGTYTYTIREKEGDDPNIVYDSHTEAVSVTVTDNGDGTLHTEVCYDADGALFTNSKRFGSLEISKTLINETQATASQAFAFTVRITDSKGNAISGTYDLLDPETEEITGSINLSDPVTLKGGESVIISGLPDGAAYEVTEGETEGFELTASSGESGVIVSGDTKKAAFENTYSTAGSVTLTAKKVLRGADIHENEFYFRLLDDEENVLDEAYANENGDVTFKPIDYTAADDGRDFVYHVKEVNTGDRGIAYDDHTEDITVHAADNGRGMIETTIEADPSGVVFTNDYTRKDLTVRKTVTGNMGSRDKTFDFTITITNAEGLGEYACSDGTHVKANTLGEIEKEISLSHGESFAVTGLPTGSVYTVSEEAYGGYQTSYAITSDGTVDAPSGDARITGSETLDGNDVVTFTNASGVNVPTGLSVKDKQALIVIIAAAAIVFIILSARRRAKSA